MRRGLRYALSALVFPAMLLAASLPAYAQETQPGDACATAGLFRESSGADATDGMHFLFCDGANWAGVLRYTSAGNVGIGTTSPSKALEVEGDALLRSGGALFVNSADNAAGYKLHESSTHLIFEPTASEMGYYGFGSTYSNNLVALLFRDDLNNGIFNAGVSTEIAGSQGVALYSGGKNTLVASFGTASWGNTTSYFAGDVGIGTSTPGAELDVIGDINYTGVIVDTSDRRLKENILPLGNSLDKITALQGVSFTMKDDKDRTELGLIAQDVEPLYPELVVTGGDGMKSLNYVGLIAPMIESIKDLKAENEQLRARLDRLERQQGSSARTPHYND